MPARWPEGVVSRLGIVATQLGILVALLVLWQFAVTDAIAAVFQPPDLVAAKLYELLSHHDIYRHIYVTLSEIAIGYALGAGFGLSLGFILGRSQFPVGRAAALHHRPLQHSEDRAGAGVHRLARLGHGVEGRGRVSRELLSGVLQHLFGSACDQRGTGAAGAPDGRVLAADASAA